MSDLRAWMRQRLPETSFDETAVDNITGEAQRVLDNIRFRSQCLFKRSNAAAAAAEEPQPVHLFRPELLRLLYNHRFNAKYGVHDAATFLSSK
ncbi:hypothetical protein GBA52_011843 [Prunus armeniaca]|nr:hypothetical protein GBA52_011843 [Prunus armeniaca]